MKVLFVIMAVMGLIIVLTAIVGGIQKYREKNTIKGKTAIFVVSFAHPDHRINYCWINKRLEGNRLEVTTLHDDKPKIVYFDDDHCNWFFEDEKDLVEQKYEELKTKQNQIKYE